ESFANLMRMLDPTAIADEKQFTREDIEHLFVRRFKKDVEGQAGSAFRERSVEPHPVEASAAETAALAALHALNVHNLGRKRHGVDQLFRWTLVKAFLSSPHACLESIDNRLKTTAKALESDETGEHPYAAALRADLTRLGEVRHLVEACLAEGEFSKLERFFAELDRIGFDGSAGSPRVVVFSERIRTLDLLKEEIARRYRVKNPDA